jgi:hypothetical protein
MAPPRIDDVLEVLLEAIAADRGCHQDELSVGVYRAAEQALLTVARRYTEAALAAPARPPSGVIRRVELPGAPWDDETTPVVTVEAPLAGRRSRPAK